MSAAQTPKSCDVLQPGVPATNGANGNCYVKYVGGVWEGWPLGDPTNAL